MPIFHQCFPDNLIAVTQPTIADIFMKLIFLLPVGAAIAYMAAFLFLRWQQKRFIFKPSPEVAVTPTVFDLPYEEVWLSVSTSEEAREKIHGWWCPQPDADAGTILYLHGNKGNMAAQRESVNLDRVAKLYSLGFSVLAIDYRGYGRSQGNFPTETRVYEDAEAAWDYLAREKQGLPEKIFIYGHSMGAAIAIELCRQHPEAAGLIVEGCFTSIKDMGRKCWLRMFPLDLLLHQRFECISKVESLQVPVLFIHGTDDRVVPVEMSQRLFAATQAPKQLVLIPEAGHDDVSSTGGDRYLATLQEFLTQSPG